MNRLFFSPAYIISHTILEGQILCYRVCVSFRVSGKSLLPVLPYHLRNSSKKKKTSSFNLLSGTASSSLWSLFSCMHFKKQAALFFRASQASSTSDWCFNLYIVSWVGRWPLSCRTSKLICSNICITQTFSFNVHTFFFFFFLGDLRMWKDGRTQKYLPTLKRKRATFNFSQLSSFFCDL